MNSIGPGQLRDRKNSSCTPEKIVSGPKSSESASRNVTNLNNQSSQSRGSNSQKGFVLLTANASSKKKASDSSEKK